MFSHLTKEDKLSHGQVNSIFRDVDGYVWISTAWGLNRYDGYNMTSFFNIASDTTSLPHNFVNRVDDIPNDRLLVRHGAGYAIFDKHTATFSDAMNIFRAKGLMGYIDRVYVDGHQRLWLTCEGACYLYSFADNSLTHVEALMSTDKSKGALVNVASSADEVLLVYSDGSLYRTSVRHDGGAVEVERLSSPLTEGEHLAIIDSDGDYWLATHSTRGVWYYERKTDKWHYCSSDKGSLFEVDNMVTNTICEDDKHRIWVAGDHDGISVIDKRTRSVVSIKTVKHDDRSLLSNSVNCVYLDSHDVVWIGYCTAGLSFYNESIYKMSIEELNLDHLDRDFLADVNCIEEDRAGNIWYGTNGNGLVYKNSRTGEVRLYRHNPKDPHSLSGDVVVALYSASDGSLWIGTYMGGLCRFDGKTFHCYEGRTDIPKAMASENIWSITEDAKHNIWVGSLGEGLVYYNPSTRAYREYNAGQGMLSSDYVSKIVVGRDGCINVGTASGVTIIDNDAKTSRLLVSDVTMGYDFENINDLYEDSRGLLWIGTRGGLSIYDKKNDVVTKLGKNDGVAFDVVNAIVEDADKNMWVATTNGITNIVVGTNPREGRYSFTMYNYGIHDGVLDCELNLRAIKRTSHNDILVGGSKGVNRFNPSTISYNKMLPEVRFVGLSVMNEEVSVGQELNGRVVLDKAITYDDEIELDYSQNMISISFSTMSNILPEKVSYSYMLEGFNDIWLTTDKPQVTYTNLASGRYTLKVKASNCDGQSNEVASELNIVILPPWWRTTWAYVLYFAVLALVVLFTRRQIMSRERERYRLKQIEADVQKQHEVDDMKLKFYTNVSHELRTPLSLIVSPLEQLLATTPDGELKSKLDMIYRNANKLLGMVNQLLDFRRGDMESMQLNLSENDIVSFVEYTCNNYRQLTERKISLVFTSSMSKLYTEFDNDKLSKIMDNLLSNAYKFTPEEGRIDVWMGKSADASNVIIKVSDSGVGIPDEYKKRVFERFFQVPHANPANGGSGIGLHMVSEFVKLHDGTIEVGDNVGQGTVFVIMLPIRTTDKVLITEDDIERNVKSDKCTLLVVDDNADFRKLLYDTFSATYETYVARDGEDALKKTQKYLPDLIITDVMMPVMDGIELCRNVKNDVRISHIPIIMLTAKAADEHKVEGLSAGADDYISKPFNPQVLTLKVANLIEKGKKRQETFRNQIDPSPSQITITPLDEKLINKAIKYVEDNMSRSDLSVEELSRNLGMSRVHLYKKFMAITGRSPIEFIRIMRLKRAAQMLADKQQNIAVVAYSVGFNNPKYFSKYFKDEFGVLPSVYQSNQEGTTTNIDITADPT
jgi:signal transduction histidine kinase/ligand-binding sensor domain-containing protein/DNA-binding response OmpR family regulator